MTRRLSVGALLTVLLLLCAACGTPDIAEPPAGDSAADPDQPPPPNDPESNNGAPNDPDSGNGSPNDPDSGNGPPNDPDSGNGPPNDPKSGNGSPNDPESGNGSGGDPKSGNGSGGDADVDYPHWGPDDPPIPEQYAALAASPGTPPDCDGLAAAQPGGDFWAVAVAVCRVLTGAADAWPELTTVPSPPPAADAFQACLDRELAAMLQAALTWHQDHPGQQLEVDYPPAGSTSPCQQQIYHVQLLDPDRSWLGDEAVPVEVGVAILGDAVSVLVDGEPPLDFREGGPRQGLRTLTIMVQRATEPRTSLVLISTDRASLEVTVDLPASTAGDSSEPTSDPSPPTGEDESTPDPQPDPDPPEQESEPESSDTEATP